MDKDNAKKGNLAITVSTFLFMAHDRGADIQHDDIRELCNRIQSEAVKPSLARVVNTIQDNLPSGVTLDTEALVAFVSENTGGVGLQQEDPFELGKELVELVGQNLDSNADLDTVLTWLQEVLPGIQNGWDIAEGQTALQAIRRYEFSRGLPWIARIAERTGNGLEEMWIMVEKVGETVLCMDPYPWDDVDEEFELDVPNFLLRWELCGCPAIHLN